MANFICVKWGDKFPAYYVNRLLRGIERHYTGDVRFICVTDDTTGIDPKVETVPLVRQPFEDAMDEAFKTSRRRGAMRKVALFNPDLIPDLEGDVLGFDLDVVITGPLNDLVDFEPGKVCMRFDWLEKKRGRFGGHGSVFKFNPQQHGYLYHDLCENTLKYLEEANFSEQKYTSQRANARDDLRFYPDDWIASFKRDAMRMPPLNHILAPKLPDNTRVMCFHGTPKMEEALVGYNGPFHRKTVPAPWLSENWVD